MVGNQYNVQQVVPFLCVTSMGRSLAYYLDGLGFTLARKWVVDGRIRWCWVTLGGAATMLQEFAKPPVVGDGLSLWFQCQDALAIYRDVTSRGMVASEPRVGNSMWDTVLVDPNGYRIHFESPTDRPEEMKLSELT